MGGQVRVRKSKIHGHGVFAARDLECGEVIEYNPRSKKFRGYNHSCEPNTVIGRIDWRKREYYSNIVVVVYRNVPKGTELTVTYGSLARVRNQKTVKAFKCNCPAH
jgi:SET domain-containing protein